MFCPKCSQEQVSDEVRFCPRCGLQLGGVQAMLAGGGQLADAAPAAGLRAQAADTRKRDVILGATVMLAVAVAVALLTVSTVAGTPLQAVIIPLLLTWAAVVSALLLSGHAAREVAKLFSRGGSEPQSAAHSDLVTRVSASARRQALPPARGAPASGFGAWRADTAELAQPLSVTEGTTGSLDRR